MIAQAMVEYGLIQSLSAALMSALHRAEYFFSTGNSRFFVLLGLVLVVGFLWTRRRSP
jgi:hypothetical protein